MFYFGKIKNTEEWGFDVFETTFDSCKEYTEEEAKEITDEANRLGKRLGGDKNGDPIFIDQPAPSEEEALRERIRELDFILSSTDWYTCRYIDTGKEIPSEVKAERQSAREELETLRARLEEITQSE